ncbi:MAG TPA: bifunctional UDP-N-acetylglucosamine diphosphorylase/glucosamine-1-phosphate N-acetyltransferase GlmU [Candidatus Sulfotelmatobacter sp.]|nr:bifunctional UDP-N-acetylglucosamine diphosphorylase/glucosamine-1-phosphate N-acetyltransferase GlmU [Candidatus Sulfotelmatobacter sp.]
MSTRAIVLAAGKGTRMKSSRPKVLHEVCGRPMLWWVLEALRAARVDEIVVVANPELAPHLSGFGVQVVEQAEQLGTGHAVRTALDALEPREGALVVAYGDMPSIDAAIVEDVQTALDADAGTALALVTARMPLPSSFGRIVRAGNAVARIVEAKDCTPAQLALDEMNAGLYAYDEGALRETIGRIGASNAQGEYYLTDTVELLIAAGNRVVPVPAADYRSVLGVNDRVELAAARAVINQRLCEAQMRAGVTIVDPATTYLAPEVTIGPDTVVYPNTAIGGRTRIGANCAIGPNCRLGNAILADDVIVTESIILDSEVGAGTRIGPFAHLRGGSRVGASVRIGDYVELKNAVLGDEVKANHLAYIGDASVGDRTNFAAGAITCNYDGVRKHRTEIGKDVFIGTNNSLVAPITIGDGALTGAGAVVIRDVPAGDKQVGNPARSIRKNPAEA